MAVKMGQEALAYWRDVMNRRKVYKTIGATVIAVGVVALMIYYY